MASLNTKVYDYAQELVETPRAHLRMELLQDENGLKLIYEGKPLIDCYLTRQGMVAGTFLSQALGVKVPSLGESVPVRVSTGVLFRAMGVADLDYSVEESGVILERLLEEAQMQRGAKGTVSEI